MSWRAIAWAKQTKVGDATRKAILLVLADYADEDGSCFPAQSTIAEEAETSERTVRRVLGEFETRGIVFRRPRYSNGGRTSDRIFLNTDWALRPALPMAVPDTVSGGQSDRWPNDPSPTGTGDRDTGQSLAGESLEEPPEPPVEEPHVEATASTRPEIEDLCQYLARGIAHHRGKHPKVTAAWRRDMDLLQRRGPTTWAQPVEIPLAEVKAVVKDLFTKLGVKDRTFCWADQVESAGGLRKHWDRIQLARRDEPSRGANAIEEAQRMYQKERAAEEADEERRTG